MGLCLSLQISTSDFSSPCYLRGKQGTEPSQSHYIDTDEPVVMLILNLEHQGGKPYQYKVIGLTQPGVVLTTSLLTMQADALPTELFSYL